MVVISEVVNIAVLPTSAKELEQILKQRQKFIFASAVGQEERQVRREIGSLDGNIFGELLGFMGMLG